MTWPATARVVRGMQVVLLSSIVLAACSTTAGDAGTTGATGSQATLAGVLVVSAAASLQVPFERIGDELRRAHPDLELRFDFGSSSALSRQIRDGAPADVFASADENAMRSAIDAGVVEAPGVVFARNRLAIVVKRGNPLHIERVGDLTRAGTVALCAAEAPCGAYAAQVIDRAGTRLATDRITRAPDARAAFSAVSQGDADAGIVYVTDIVGDRAQAIAIPDAQNVVASYPIGVVRDTTNRAAAVAFVAAVRSPSGRTALQDQGFALP